MSISRIGPARECPSAGRPGHIKVSRAGDSFILFLSPKSTITCEADSYTIYMEIICETSEEQLAAMPVAELKQLCEAVGIL
jgi:hypothetical protein